MSIRSQSHAQVNLLPRFPSKKGANKSTNSPTAMLTNSTNYTQNNDPGNRIPYSPASPMATQKPASAYSACLHHAARQRPGAVPPREWLRVLSRSATLHVAFPCAPSDRPGGGPGGEGLDSPGPSSTSGIYHPASTTLCH